MDVSADVRPAPVAPAPGRTGAGTAAWAASAAIVAAAVAVDPAGLRPFTTLRWALVGTALAVAGVATARRSSSGHPPLPRWATAAGVAVVASMVAAATLVGDPATAWLGHPQRHLGVLAWVVFAVAAATGAALAGDPAGRRLVAQAGLAAGLATSAGALAGLLGWSPTGAEFAGGRVGGLLGQPTTLGALAVLLVPLAGAASADRRLRFAVVAALLASVVASQTRGALLGLLAIAVVSLPAVLPRIRASHLAWLPLVGLVLAVTPAGDRLLSTGASGRPDDWRLGMEVVADHPLLGVGPEGYRIAVLDAFDAAYVEEHGRQVVVDRAHSAPLDVATTGGLAAGVAYAALLAGVAASTWRLQRRRPWSVAAAAGAGATGTLVAGLVAFPTPGIDAVAWLLAGLALASAAGTVPRPTPPLRRRAATAAAAAVLVACAVAGATDVGADRRLGDAVDLAAAGRTQEAVAAADRATALRPDVLDAWYVAAQVAASGGTILDLDAAIDRAAAGRHRSPDDPALRALHAALVGERALRSGLAIDHAVARRVVDAALDADRTAPELQDLRARLRAARRADATTADGTRRPARPCLSRCDSRP